MTIDETQELADSIEAEKLWQVHEIVIQPGYPRDTWLRVKRSVYSPESEIGSV